MSTKQKGLQFYSTMAPGKAAYPRNGSQAHVPHSSSNTGCFSMHPVPVGLNFYPSMSAAKARPATGILPSSAASDSSAKQPPKNQPATRAKLPYAVQCEVRQQDQNAGTVPRIACKQEQVPQEFGGSIIWNYTHDQKGHLAQAKRNGIVIEEYLYDTKGARVQATRNFGGSREIRDFTYDADGQLVSAGERTFAWAPDGSLKSMKEPKGATTYSYGKDTRLDKAILSDGTRIDCRYGKGLMPVSIARNGLPLLEYEWQDTLRLKSFHDTRENLTMVFHYRDEDDSGVSPLDIQGFLPNEAPTPTASPSSLNRLPHAVTLHGYEAIIQRITGICSAHLRLDIHTDHLGSVRMLTTLQKNLHEAKVVQYIEYDSFGNPIICSNSGLRLPLGFAGGLNDPFTGFVRFGFRDYDPIVGRFTAKDPLGDTGGDHDLWDYCVDDPVSMIDPEGLKEKSWRKRFLEWYSPLIFMEEGPEKAALRAQAMSNMQGKVFEMASGLRSIVKWNLAIPTGLPGPSDEDMEKFDKQWEQTRQRYEKK